MKTQTENPKFCTVLYSVLKELKVSVPEYVYLDMVYYLSRNGWCYKSLKNIGDDLGMRKSAIFYMRNRLVKRGLLEINDKSYVRTTDVWHNALATHPFNVQKMNATDFYRSKSAPNRSIIEPERSKSVDLTDARNTIRNTKKKGYLKFQKKRQELGL
jgi:hypothetical protein